MRIIVDKMPKKSSNCLFRKYYSETFRHWTCGFSETSVCFLDCGGKCPYLYEWRNMERGDDKE